MKNDSEAGLLFGPFLRIDRFKCSGGVLRHTRHRFGKRVRLGRLVFSGCLLPEKFHSAFSVVRIALTTE